MAKGADIRGEIELFIRGPHDDEDALFDELVGIFGDTIEIRRGAKTADPTGIVSDVSAVITVVIHAAKAIRWYADKTAEAYSRISMDDRELVATLRDHPLALGQGSPVLEEQIEAILGL